MARGLGAAAPANDLWERRRKPPSPKREKAELLREAEHHDVPVRRKAMLALRKHREDGEAIAALAKGLGDEDVAVQLGAQQAFRTVTDTGDERTVAAVLAQVGSKCEWTRIAALCTLADVTDEFGRASRGALLDLEVDTAVEGRLEDEYWGVRRAAIDTMAKRAPPQDEKTIAAAERLLEDQMGTVRESAIKAIASLSAKGDRRAIDLISPRLDDWHESVRRAAVIGVAKVAEPGDEHAVELCKAGCEDRSWIVRKAATDSLARVATPDDLASLRKLATMLEDFDPLPRMAAVYGIAELCGVNHGKAIALALARLEHRDAGTRQASVQLLEKVASRENDRVKAEIRKRLEDEDEHVRDSAHYGLIEIDKNEPGRWRWFSDLPDLSNLDDLGLDSDSDDELEEGG